MDVITTSTALQKAYQYIKADQRREALNLLTPICHAEPDNLQVWYLIGLAQVDTERRIHAFEQVLRLDPANQPAKKQIAKLRVAPHGLPTQTESVAAENIRAANDELLVALRWTFVLGTLLLFGVSAVVISVWWFLQHILL